MLTVHTAMEQLLEDELFINWHKEHPTAYLCHCMRMLGDEDAWHIGYYLDDTIQTFVVSPNDVAQEKQDEVFKKPDSVVKELDFSQVDLTATQAVQIAIEFQKKEFPSEIPSKQIIILQHIDAGQVYNITFVTLAMSTLNIKVDAKTGEVKEHKRTSLMDFRVDGAGE